MIATGTDVTPLECVFFLRPVRSATYFEQMKGRGARTIDPAEFQAVTPDAEVKDRFVIVDAVGVTEADLDEAVPLQRHSERQISLRDLLRKAGTLTATPDEVATLAARLARLDQQLTDDERDELADLAGQPLNRHRARPGRRGRPGTAQPRPRGRARRRTRADGRALRPLAANPQLRERILEIRRAHDITIDEVNRRHACSPQPGVPAEERAQVTVKSWHDYLEQHRDEITALQVFYEGRGRVDFEQLKDLAPRIARPPQAWTPDSLWKAYVLLGRTSAERPAIGASPTWSASIRYELGLDQELRPYRSVVEERFRGWLLRQEQAGVTFTCRPGVVAGEDQGRDSGQRGDSVPTTWRACRSASAAASTASPTPSAPAPNPSSPNSTWNSPHDRPASRMGADNSWRGCRSAPRRQRSPKNHTGANMRPYLRAGNVGWQGLKLDDVKEMNFTDDEVKVYELRPGDIVLGEASGSPDEVGKPALWNDEIEECCFQNTLIRVRSHGPDPRYLLHFLRHEALRGAFVEHSRGVGIHHLGAAQLSAWPVLVPPLAEQRRIVAALEDHLSRLDVASTLLKTIRPRSAALRNSCLDRAVRGTLLGSGQRLDAVGSRSEVRGRSGKKIDYSKLPPLPIGWKWRAAEDVCVSITSGSTPPADLMHTNDGGIPFLKVYNLTKVGSVDFTIRPTFVDKSTHEGQLRRSRVKPQDVLTNIVGPPLGKTAIVPDDHLEWNINQAIVAFRAGPEILPKWLSLTLQSPLILGLLKDTARATAGQFNIALSTCRELPLPVPPLEQQQHLVTAVDAILSAISVAGNHPHPTCYGGCSEIVLATGGVCRATGAAGSFG